MKSRQQLVLRALQYLKVVGAGQTASAEDAKAIDDEVEPIMADLATRNIWQWGDPDQIADEAFVHLAIIIGNSRASEFGMTPDEGVRLLAEARLRDLQQTVDAGDPICAEYF